MSLLNSKLSLLIVLFLLNGLLTGCRKNEITGIENSAITILGNNSVVELKKIHPLPDGGFIIVATSMMKGSKDAWILRYDARFQMLWERFVGSESDENIFAVATDNNGNILVGGRTYGYGREKDTLVPRYDSDAYYFMLNSSGTLLWEKSFLDTATIQGRGIEAVTAISNDGDTGFIICGNIQNYPFLKGWFIKTDLNGTIKTEHYQSNYSLEAIFTEDKDNYICYCRKGFISDKLGFLQIPKNSPSGLDQFQNIRLKNGEQPTPFNNPYPKFTEASFYPELSVYITYGNIKNKIFKYTYNAKTTTLTKKDFDYPLANLTGLDNTPEENLLFMTKDGVLYEFSKDLVLLSKYSTGFEFNTSCKLINGNYVLGMVNLNTLYVMFLDKNGLKIIP